MIHPLRQPHTQAFVYATKKRKESGFTLIEWMVSMIILGITIISIISMQTASLQTHIDGQDVTLASGMADHTLELLQLDAMRWRDQLSLSTTRYLNNDALHPITPAGTAAIWIPYTLAPVNFQMRTLAQGPSGLSARFCVFYSYRWVANDVTTQFNNNLMEVNTSVLWPRKMEGLPTNLGGLNLRQFFDTCGTNAGAPDFVLISSYLQDPNTLQLINRFMRQVRQTTYIRRNVLGL